MNLDLLLWVCIGAVVGAVVLAYQFGYHHGRDDREFNTPQHQAEPEHHAEFWDQADLNAIEDKWERWLAETDTEEVPERLADTGERAIIRAAASLSDTGELRALAYAGDTAALQADNAAYVAQLDTNTEGEVA